MNKLSIQKYLEGLSRKRGAIFGAILVVALLAFEAFNYSTTEFSLRDVLGPTPGLRWSVLLAIAFCAIDFAGLARMFTPEQGRDEHREVWYLFGAWLLAGAMNTILTWWGVSVAIANQAPAGTAMVSSQALARAVPVFVALIVWMIRILIIGTFAVAGERLFSMADRRANSRPQPAPQIRPGYSMTRPAPSAARPRPAIPASSLPLGAASSMMSAQGSSAPAQRSQTASVSRAEPTYHPVGLSASPSERDAPVRR
jgi:hypothetical protein